jgi:arsenate reductase-like glutaredoxin family protein|tara:strand:+ start:1353 stop:1529 length:177 start_codon:yes stop_codon:yes gene_type:complete
MVDKRKRREPAFDDSAEKIEQQLQRDLLKPPPTNKELEAVVKSSKTPVTDLMRKLRGR